jgi:hypothetical protein
LETVFEVGLYVFLSGVVCFFVGVFFNLTWRKQLVEVDKSRS